jgi:hypothetical protein
MKPRNLAGPIVRGGDFWGRNAEIDELWHLLEKGDVLLAGPRRYGKSSIMYALLDNPMGGWHPLYLDLESVETPVEFVTTLGAELLCRTRLRELLIQAKSLPAAFRGWITSSIDGISVEVPDVGSVKLALRKAVDDPAKFGVLADQLLDEMKGLPDKTAILLDEFPMMVSAMLDKDQAGGLRFLKWFRAARQNPGTEGLSLLLGGSLNIEPRLEQLGSEALLGHLQRLRLSPMSRDQSLRFIKEVFDGEQYEVEQGVAEEILRIARTGVHYYLQVIIQECLALARREGRLVMVSDVARVYAEKVVGPEGRHRFSHYHTRLRHYGSDEYIARTVLDYLCRNADASASELVRVVAESGADPSRLNDVMIRLEGDYYVVKEGSRYRFTDGLLTDWWIRNSVKPNRS